MTPSTEDTPTSAVQIDLVPGAPFGTVTLPSDFRFRDIHLVRERIGSCYELMPLDEYWVQRGSETVLGIRRVQGMPKAAKRFAREDERKVRPASEGSGRTGSIRSDVLFYTTREAAEYLRLSPNTLRQYRCRGIGPIFHKVGTKVLYRLSDLNDFVSKGRVV